MSRADVFYIGPRLEAHAQWRDVAWYRGPGWYWAPRFRSGLVRMVGPFASCELAVAYHPGIGALRTIESLEMQSSVTISQ